MPFSLLKMLVEPVGLEPTASCLQNRRSPRWAMAPWIWPRFFVILTEVYGSSSDQLQHNLVPHERFERPTPKFVAWCSKSNWANAVKIKYGRPTILLGGLIGLSRVAEFNGPPCNHTVVSTQSTPLCLDWAGLKTTVYPKKKDPGT